MALLHRLVLLYGHSLLRPQDHPFLNERQAHQVDRFRTEYVILLSADLRLLTCNSCIRLVHIDQAVQICHCPHVTVDFVDHFQDDVLALLRLAHVNFPHVQQLQKTRQVILRIYCGIAAFKKFLPDVAALKRFFQTVRSRSTNVFQDDQLFGAHSLLTHGEQLAAVVPEKPAMQFTHDGCSAGNVVCLQPLIHLDLGVFSPLRSSRASKISLSENK